MVELAERWPSGPKIAASAVYPPAAFKDKELADLTLAIGLINLYNRNNVSLRRPPASLARLEAREKAHA